MRTGTRCRTALRVLALVGCSFLVAGCGASSDDDDEFTSRGGGGGGGFTACDELQAYYDGCCDVCGARDSYCGPGYDVSGNSVSSCRSQLDDEDTARCYCDLF